MTADSFEEGILLGMLLSRGSSGSAPEKPVIKPLTVTKNGTYTAPNGIDGYSPVSVGVDDRYDEGYQDGYDDGYSDGYDDAKDIYEKLIAQGNGDGETVEDDNGNIIDNAIVTNNPDELKDLLEGVVFPSGGGEVTVQGLSGADCSFKIECVTTEKTMSDGSIETTTGAKITATNLLTGKTISFMGNGNLATTPPNKITFKITNVIVNGVNNNINNVSVGVQFYKNGEPITSSYGTQSLSVSASNVGGTSFGTSDTQWAMTQAKY